jgi:hypothetical protein
MAAAIVGYNWVVTAGLGLSVGPGPAFPIIHTSCDA